MTLNVGCRILFRVTELLSERESVSEGHIVIVHLREDEVGRAVEYTRDLVYVVSRETAVERADNRDSAADARLEEEVAVVRLSCREEDIAFFCDELLVGRGHALAPFEAGLDERECRLYAAHALGNSRYLVVVEDVVEVLREFILIR